MLRRHALKLCLAARVRLVGGIDEESPELPPPVAISPQTPSSPPSIAPPSGLLRPN
jgi:hypothetical protein